jgi:hypothetical protein
MKDETEYMSDNTDKSDNFDLLEDDDIQDNNDDNTEELPDYESESEDTEKKTSSWKKDTTGKKIELIIVKPIVKKLDKKTRKNIAKYVKNKEGRELTMNEINNLQILNKFLQQIETGKITKQVNKYIAPYFDLEKNVINNKESLLKNK